MGLGLWPRERNDCRNVGNIRRCKLAIRPVIAKIKDQRSPLLKLSGILSKTLFALFADKGLFRICQT